MQQGQDFRRFGYKPLQGGQYAQPRVSRSDYFDPQDDNNNFIKRISGGIMAGLTHSPLFSTFAVLAAGAAFTFAVYSFYPSSDDEMEAVPIIKAEAVPIKMEPSETGGMEIPYQDSTIFDAERMAASGGGKIENLLEPSADAREPVKDKESLLAEQSSDERGSEMANITENPAFAKNVAQETEIEAGRDSLDAPIEKDSAAKEKPVQNILAAESEPESVSEESVAAVDMEEKVESKPEAVAAVESDAKTEQVPPAKTVQTSPAMNEAGQSPETLAFVRSVLEKKDAQKSASAPDSSAPETVEPAAGVEGTYSGAKTHYVQLASISDRSRADKEWVKLKESMAAIPGSSGYRVEEANLDKGTFFRIQAGPYSEAQAKDICDAIKVQKPGGCLVVR